MATGGFSIFEKIKIALTPSKNNGATQIVVRNTTDELGALEYLDKDEFIADLPFVPLAGTEEDKPITGELEVVEAGRTMFIETSEYENQMSLSESGASFFAKNKSNDNFIGITAEPSTNIISVTTNNTETKGIVGSGFFDKQDDPNAFTQVDDVVLRKGTLSDKPITGDLELGLGDKKIYHKTDESDIGSDIESAINFGENGNLFLYSTNNTTGFTSSIDVSDSVVQVTNDNPSTKGIVGNVLFDKDSDPNAFAQLGDITESVSIDEFKIPFGTGTGLQQDDSFTFREGLNPDTVPYKRLIIGNPTNANLLTKQAGMLIYGEEGVLPRVALLGVGNGLGRNKATLAMWHMGGDTTTPTATPSGTIVGQPYFAGYDGVDEFREGASIIATTTGTVSPTSAPMKLEFSTAPSGSVTPVVRVQIGSDGATKMFGTAESTALTITGAGTNANATYGKINLPQNAFIQGSANPLTTSSYVQFTQENSTKAGYASWMTHNAYFDGTDWRQPRGAISSNLFSTSFHNAWVWRTAAAGTTNDGVITPTNVMSLSNAGLLTTASLNLTGLTASSLVFTDASKNLTSTGTVPANRGGTGITSYTTGNYVNAASSTTLQQRTPAQVASDIGAVTVTGAQTVAGIKTFSDSPIAPTPTTGTQLANKTYVDDTVLRASSNGYVEKTATYTTTLDDGTINCTTGTFTVTLAKTGITAGKIFRVKNTGTGTITVDVESAGTIDGVTSKIFNVQYSGAVFQYTGTNYILIGEF